MARPGLLLGRAGRLAGGDRRSLDLAAAAALARERRLGDRLRHALCDPGHRGRCAGRREVARARRLGDKAPLGVAIFYALAVLLWGAAIWTVRPDWLALLALAPAALHLANQALRADPEATARLALRLFRSNRICGLLVFLAMLVVGLSSALERAPCMLPIENARRDRRGAGRARRDRRRRRRRRALRRRSLDQRAGPPRRARGGPALRRRGDRPAPASLGSARRRVASSDFSDEALARAGRAGHGDGAEAPEDPYAGLAPAELLQRGDLPTSTPRIAREPRPGRRCGRGRWRPRMRRSAVRGVTNSSGGARRRSGSDRRPRDSAGFAGAYRATGHSCSAGVDRRRGRGDAARPCLAQRAPPRRSRRRPRRSAGWPASAPWRGSTRSSRSPDAYPVLFDPRVAAIAARPFRRRDHRLVGRSQVELPAGQARRSRSSRPA